ncbi:hypothetical protein HKX48_000564 [Thoreauomyces humboldtii]|nr:hypothetical protein HKX48_000564 [Thoreauomyces humboldtii]
MSSPFKEREPPPSTVAPVASARSPNPRDPVGTPVGGATPTRRGRGQFRAPVKKDPQSPAAERRRNPPRVVYPTPREGGAGSGAKSSGRSGVGGHGGAGTASATVESVTEAVQGLGIGDGEALAGERPEDGHDDRTDGVEEEEEWEREGGAIEQFSTATTKPAKPRKPVGDFVEHENLSTTALDVHDFPSAFRTHDLSLIFEDFSARRGGFTIRWMSDTRALIVFEHPDTETPHPKPLPPPTSAKAAYAHALGNMFIRVKPYAGEIVRDRDDRPRVPAPVRSDMVARRLVAGALGMRSARKTAEEKAVDQQKLQDAKDKITAEKTSRAVREQQIQAAWDS